MSWQGMACGLSVVLAVGGLAACTDEPPVEAAPVIAPGKPGEPARTIPPGQATAPAVAPPNEADKRFIRDMIGHHQQAVEMSGLAPERAANDKIKSLADRVSGSQRAEINGMNSWLSTHGQPTVDPGHGEHGGHATMPGMATPAQLDALRAAKGPEFDKLFLQLMIAHHQGALTMAAEVRNIGADGRVQEIVDEITATQSAEISRMKGMQGP